MTGSSDVASQRGFALLTVIVIVMALTILGLSLFSLSSFEAQFFRPTLDYTQAMESTRGGIEWARYVLESTDSFDKVRTSTKPPGVAGVVARKGLEFDAAESTGIVFEDPPKLVWIRSVGSENGREGAVLARFNPMPGQNLYKRLVTVMDSMLVNDEGAHPGNTLLYGNISIGAPELRDYDGNPLDPTVFKGLHCMSQQALLRPELDLRGTWWTQKYAAAQYAPNNGGPFTLGTTGSAAAVYRTDPGESYGSPNARQWSVQLEGAECTVNVRGTVIWMFPEGLRCDTQLRFHNVGSGAANVILVGRPGPDSNGKEDHVAFALLGGIWVEPGVNLFIASTGGVEIEHDRDAQTAAGFAGYLSIYADWARFMGPNDPVGGANADMDLHHGTNSCSSPTQDDKDGIVDQLIEQNLLPNSRFARRRLQFVAGSWEEKSATVGN